MRAWNFSVTSRILWHRKVIPLVKRAGSAIYCFVQSTFPHLRQSGGLDRRKREREGEREKKGRGRLGQRRVKKRVERGKCTRSRDEKSFVDLAEI